MQINNKFTSKTYLNNKQQPFSFVSYIRVVLFENFSILSTGIFIANKQINLTVYLTMLLVVRQIVNK